MPAIAARLQRRPACQGCRLQMATRHVDLNELTLGFTLRLG
jgi:hypothetical protein